jgi:hypothetical protein
MTLISKGAEFERQALGDPARYSMILALLGLIVALARWRTTAAANSEGAELRFEEEAPPVITSLGLDRDGALSIEAPPARSPLR